MNFIRFSFALLCTVCAAVFVTSCSDNPADSTTSEHVEAFGLVIYNSGEEIVRYQNGVVEGEIEVAKGDETPLLTVRFLDEKGALIAADKLTSSVYSLKWAVGDDDIAEVEHHDDDGKWNLHIVGKGEGETTLKLMLYHNDHADFTSKDIPIHVQPGVSGVQIAIGGTTVVTANEETASGALTLTNGVPSTAEFRFTDSNGVIELSDEASVEVVVADPSFVDVIPGSSTNVVAFTPKKAGSTTFRIRLKHTDEHGHEGVLYESPAIGLTVE